MKPIRRSFPRSTVVVDTINSMWDGDLADVSNLSSDNEGYKILLLFINILSRSVHHTIEKKTAKKV